MPLANGGGGIGCPLKTRPRALSNFGEERMSAEEDTTTYGGKVAAAAGTCLCGCVGVWRGAGVEAHSSSATFVSVVVVTRCLISRHSARRCMSIVCAIPDSQEEAIAPSTPLGRPGGRCTNAP
jgi:hypothetical protein